MSENQAAIPAREETKPESNGTKSSETQYIKIKVKAMDGTEVHFKLKQATTLSKLITNYCNKMDVPTSAYRFMFEGVRIDPDKTPQDYQMEDDDIIDVFSEQQGGVCSL